MVREEVVARVAYVNDEWREREELPRIYSRASRESNTTIQDVVIRSARDLHALGALDLDVQGFAMTSYTGNFTRFADREAVLSTYFEQMRDLLLATTGAHAALPFPFYQVRSATPEHFFDAYSLYMHCDYSMRSCVAFAQSIIRRNGETYPEKDWDFAFYNLWKPVAYPVERDPLVWIDAQTVEAQDIIDYHPVQDEEEKGVAALPLFNPGQRHYYMPDMTPDEVLILKQLDSRPGKAQVCPHTSFVDPGAHPQARPRQSIDVRFLCMFEKDKDKGGE